MDNVVLLGNSNEKNEWKPLAKGLIKLSIIFFQIGHQDPCLLEPAWDYFYCTILLYVCFTSLHSLKLQKGKPHWSLGGHWVSQWNISTCYSTPNTSHKVNRKKLLPMRWHPHHIRWTDCEPGWIFDDPLVTTDRKSKMRIKWYDLLGKWQWGSS